MNLAQRLELIQARTQEVVTVEDLRALLQGTARPKAYVGLEPSGLLHIGQGLILGDKVRDFVEAGVDFTFLLADWHAYINDKLGGRLEIIKLCGAYLRDCFTALGLPPEKVRYLYASELVDRKEYWQQVINVSKSASLARIKRALTIMGRKEAEADLDASKLIYPAMQVADIHMMDLDIAYSGIDQRHAHMLYRDLSSKLGWKTVVAVHTPLLTGLQGGPKMDAAEAKMSKSKPEGAILVHDQPEAIQRKLAKAFCPPREAEGNPLMDICRHLIFPVGGRVTVERDAKHGGDVTYESYESLATAYERGELHPQDLKATTARLLAMRLAPVREYFARHPDNLRALEAAIGEARG